MGVSTLLMTEDSSDTVVLVVVLPKESIGLRREQRAGMTAIEATCFLPSGRNTTTVVPHARSVSDMLLFPVVVQRLKTGFQSPLCLHS